MDAKGLSGDARAQWVVCATDTPNVVSLRSKAFPKRFLAMTVNHGLKTSFKGAVQVGLMSGESERDCYFNVVNKQANVFSLQQATKHGIVSFNNAGAAESGLAHKVDDFEALFQVIVLEGLLAKGNLITVQSELTGKFLRAYDHKDPSSSGIGSVRGRVDCNGQDSDGTSGWIVHSGGSVATLARGGGSGAATIRLQNFENSDYWLKISDQGGLGIGDGVGKEFEHAVDIVEGDTVNLLSDAGGKFAAVNKQGKPKSGKNLSPGDPACNFKINLVQQAKEYPSIKGHGDHDDANAEEIRY